MQYDVIIIGAGPSGLAAAARCLRAGLTTAVLERGESIGGLWRDLPDWQDIQLPKQDWTVAGTEIFGVKREAIVANLLAFTHRERLDPHILLNHAVCDLSREGELWHVTTQEGASLFSGFVIVATGPHQRRFIPDIPRSDVSLDELHSSELRDPQILRGATVVVQGAGASALDVLDLALTQGARKIHWVHQRLRWMIPSSQPKTARSYLRALARAQMLGTSIEAQNRETNQWLRSKYRYFGMEDILPDADFDWQKDQLIPGRPALISRLAEVERHKGRVTAVSGNEVVLDDGSISADILVHGTGYRIEFDSLGLELLKGINTPHALNDRCACLCKSLDYPNLFFLGIPSAEMTGTTLWAQSIIARSIASHICDDITFPSTSTPLIVNHWDLLKVLASFDRKNFPPVVWRLKYLLLAIWYARFSSQPVRI